MSHPAPTPHARRRTPKAVGVLLVLAILASVEPSGKARAQLGNEGDDVGMGAQDHFDINESVFHQWIFGAGNKIVSTPEHLDSLLMLRVSDIDRACSLTETQRRKLVLAGRGDGKRFLDRVADARRAYERVRHEPDGAAQLYPVTQPLAADFAAGLFGEGSFFSKTLGATLTPEQAGRYRDGIVEKGLFRYKAKVSLVVASIDSRVGLSSDQYKRFTDLILKDTTPPSKAAGEHEPTVVLCKIASLPEAKVRPIFDETQWAKLSRIFQKARASEAFLRANGHLE